MMASCYKVYIFCTGGLKFQTYIYKLCAIYCSSKSILAYLIVLTKGTAQGTACKKDCSAAAKDCYEGFFAKMEACKSNAKVGGFAAKASCDGAVHPALSWALQTFFIKSIQIQNQYAPFETKIIIMSCKIFTGKSSAS